MNDFIESPVIIESKEQLKHVFGKRFAVNSDSYQIDDHVWAPGSLFFLGFAGAIQGDGKYHGVYRFRHAQPKDSDRDGIAFGKLPGTHGYELKPKPKQKKGKV